MKKSEIIRAWRDEEYFESLSESERAALPAHPSGLSDLKDEDLRGVEGAMGNYTYIVHGCPNPYTALCTYCNGTECY